MARCVVTRAPIGRVILVSAALAGGVALSGCAPIDATEATHIAGCNPDGFGPMSGCGGGFGAEQVADQFSVGCNPDGFGPLSGCGSNRESTAGGATATYETLADLAAGAGIPRADQDDMVAIAVAESSGRLGVVHRNSNGTYDRCAWQINDANRYDHQRLVTDPAYCAQAAAGVLAAQGLGAWTVYRSGAYREFLGEARAAVRS